MISLAGLRYAYSLVRAVSPKLGEQNPPDDKHTTANRFTLRHALWGRLGVIWPLALHLFGALGISALLRYYVDNNHFNIIYWVPDVPLGNGISFLGGPIPASLRQSDINTILSAALVVLRWITAAWAGPLCWRILFFLMEKTGLRRRDLEWFIGYGCFPPFTHFRHGFIVFVAATLTSTLLAQSASPILTGSITWAPSHVTSKFDSDAFRVVNVPVAKNNSVSWQSYAQPSVQSKIAVKAAGFANQAWGRGIEKASLKRVLSSAYGLNIGSIVSNLTLPYFQVTTLEWVLDPEAYNLTRFTVYGSGMGAMQIDYLEQTPGALAILPNTPQRNMAVGTVQVVDSYWPFPLPSTVSETRTLVLTVGRFLRGSGGNRGCQELSRRIVPHSFSQKAGLVPTERSCLAFAQVTYTAGAGVCTSCRLSSPSTLQNDSEISLQPDTMTTEALWNMPNVSCNLVLINTSLPSPWDDANNYAIQVLARSYSGAWSALHEIMADPNDTPITSRVYPTVPSLQAQLDLWRVYAWLGLQLLVTVTGIIFLCLQSRSKYPLTSDTTMAAFDLDTTDADNKSLLKIERKGDRRKIVVDSQPAPKNL